MNYIHQFQLEAKGLMIWVSERGSYCKEGVSAVVRAMTFRRVFVYMSSTQVALVNLSLT